MQTKSTPAIVLVDDEKAYTDVMCESLGALLSTPVVTFTRPLAALQALPDLEVKIIISDYFMPQMDGLSFLRQVHELKPGTPCIMLTGHCDTFEADVFDELKELKEILAKPFPARVLATVIQKYWATTPSDAAPPSAT